MSVEIYDSSSESSLSSDEYEDEDDLMNMAVSSTGPNNLTSPTKSAKTVSSGDGSPNKSNVKRAALAPPRNREQTSKQIMLLTKKKRLHQFYKNRSIKFMNEKGKRQELGELLKERIRFRQIDNARIMEIKKLRDLEKQSVAIARQELENLRAKQQLYSQQQRAAAAAAAAKSIHEQEVQHDQQQQQRPVKDIIAQVRQDMQAQQQLQQQRLQRTPSKSPELVCLDDTEGEESPQKSDKSAEKVDKEPVKLMQATNEVNNMINEDVLHSAPQATNEEVIVTEVNEIIANTIGVSSEANLVEDAIAATVAVEEVEIVNTYRDEVQQVYTNMEVSADIYAPTADVPMDECISVCQETIVAQIDEDDDDDDVVKFLEPKKQPVNTNVDLSMPTLKNSTNISTNTAQPEQMPIKKRTPPPPPPPPIPKALPPTAHMGKPVQAMQAQAMQAQAQAMQAPQIAHMQAPFSQRTAQPLVSTPIRDNKTQQLQQTHASNMSVKRRRSPTPEAPPSVEQGTQTVPEALKTITDETNDEQKAKRPMLDPASNAAFYDKIKDLLPAYEEAITVQVQAATTTEDKLNEKIQRINSDLKTLGDVLKTKEQEWNRLLYLKRVKEELLERLLRSKNVLKTTNRYDNLQTYSLKQLNELETYLTEVRADQVQQDYEPQPSSILTKLIKSRADMQTADLRAEIEKIRSFKELILNSEKIQEECNKESIDNRATQSERSLNNSKRQQDEQWRDLEERRAHIDNQLKQLRYEREQQKQQDYLQQSQAERSLRQLTVQQQQQQRQFDDSYSQQQQRQLNSMQIDNTPEVAPTPPTTTAANMGRHGAFKDVKSIIEDFRREHPEMMPPRIIKRANVATRPKPNVSNNNIDNSSKQDSSVSYDGIPTLQKLLSGVSGSNYQQQSSQQQREQHSGMAQISKPPIYRQNYTLANTSAINTSQDSNMSLFDKRQEDPLLNVLRNSIINGLESFNNTSTSFTTNGNGGQTGRSNGRICQECYRSEARFLCGGCSNQWYCSRGCQLSAWDRHHFICGV